jgi:tetratricopeptide (TPR) repeat protein
MKTHSFRFSAALSCLFLIMAVVLPPRPCPAAPKMSDIPLPARVALSRAAALMREKAYDRAIEVLSAFQARGGPPEKQAKTDPRGYHHPEIYFAIGTCYLFENDCKRAAPLFEKALEKDPAFISAWLNLARAEYELGDYRRAAQCFENAYDRAIPQNPEHLYYCGAAYLMAREYEPSIRAFQRLLKSHPEEFTLAWRETFVHALLSAGRPAEALPHIRLLTQSFTGEKQVQWQEILLQEYMQLDMRREALSYARSLTEQAPTRAKWWKALAHLHLQQNAYKPALAALTIYSYLSPLTDVEARLLADLHLQLGIPAKAAPLYESELAKKTDTRLLHNLVAALQQLGKPEEALEALMRFAPGSKDAELLVLRADLLYSLKLYRQAAESYLLAAKTDTRHTGRAWLMAGYAALQAHDDKLCRFAFRHAAAFRQYRKPATLALQQFDHRTQTLQTKASGSL